MNGHGKVSQVELTDGTIIDADLVIFGTGVHPNVSFLGDIKLNQQNGGVETDVFLRTDKANVWAAGDVARYIMAQIYILVSPIGSVESKFE